MIETVRLAVCAHLLEHFFQAADLRADAHFQAAQLHGQFAAHIGGRGFFQAALFFGQLLGQFVDFAALVGNQFVFGFGGITALAQGKPQLFHGHAVDIVQRHTVNLFTVGQAGQGYVFFYQ